MPRRRDYTPSPQAIAAAAASAARYVARLEQGYTTADLAAEDNLTQQAVSAFLRWHGLPSSRRQAMRERDRRQAQQATSQQP